MRGLKFDGKPTSEKTNHIFQPLEPKGVSRVQVQDLVNCGKPSSTSIPLSGIFTVKYYKLFQIFRKGKLTLFF